MKKLRFIFVLAAGGILLVANIYFVFNSFYCMGKHDAEKKFLEIQHIQSFEIPSSKDSISSQSRIKNDELRVK